MQTGNIPLNEPEFTLAWDILAWGEKYLVQPDGENAGDPFKFTDEQIRFLAWFYAVDKNGRWIYRTGSLRRAKGWGKSPLLAALCIIEFCGPSRFSHWGADGQPIGKAEHSPWIQIAATSIDQTANTFDSLRGMLVASPLVHTIGIDIGKTIVQFKNGRPGKVEPVTANSVTLEGGRPTFAVLLPG